jgi:5-methylcytosine-specific restriction endonuclease McrA
MPVDWSKYPNDWQVIRNHILTRAQNRCEFCGAANKQPHPETGSKVVLTIAHLDHDPSHNHFDNLKALCQKCHVTYDAKLHARHAAETRRSKQAQAGQLAWAF